MLQKSVKPILLALVLVAATAIPVGCTSDAGRPFTVVVLPDTQFYSLLRPEIFTAQTDWIAANKENMNVAFVLHEGDIVHNNTPAEWRNANKAMSVLDGVVPYVTAMGNHDMGKPGDRSSRNSKRYNDCFGVDRFENKPWYGDYYRDDGRKNENSYYRFKVSGMKFLVVSLEWSPRNEVLAWANKVIDKHADYRTIILTHSYVTPHNKRLGRREMRDGNSGRQIWEKLAGKHANIFLVLSGHFHGVGRLSSTGEKGDTVHQLLADYQGYPNGGDGWLRILKFVPKENRIYVSTYSPTLKKYMTDPNNQFVLEYNMTPARR